MVSHIRIYYKQQGQTTWIIDSPWGRTLSPGARVDNWGRRPQFPTKKTSFPFPLQKIQHELLEGVSKKYLVIFQNQKEQTRKAFVFIHYNTF